MTGAHVVRLGVLSAICGVTDVVESVKESSTSLDVSAFASAADSTEPSPQHLGKVFQRTFS